MTVFIYSLCDPDTGEIRYVGKAADPAHRLGQHLCEKKQTHKCAWVQSLIKQGKQPRLAVLEEVAADAWQRVERAWIRKLRLQGYRLTNLTNGGEGSAGAPVTAQTREKMRQSAIRREEAKRQAGYTVSEDVRQRISQKLRGRVVSAETGRKISVAKKGCKRRPVSTETRKKISAGNRGKTRTPEARERYRRAAQARARDPVWREKMRQIALKQWAKKRAAKVA